MGKTVPPIPIPHPAFLDGMEYLGVRGGQKVWRSDEYALWVEKPSSLSLILQAHAEGMRLEKMSPTG
jgi:hypothetical protein